MKCFLKMNFIEAILNHDHDILYLNFSFRYKPPNSDELQTENIQISSPKKNEYMVVHKVIRGLKPGVYYQFWVSAVNALNNEGPTSMVQGYRHERRRNIELEASRGKLRSLENVSLT